MVVNANYEDGIVSKDDLIITNATIKVTSKDDGIRGKDCVDVKDANITINADGDGITTTNDSDSEKGYVIINGGTIKVSAGDDGINAETNIIINGGTIDITKCYEGIEASYIEINDGDISVVASDDGINVSDGSGTTESGERMGQTATSSNVELVINGGKIYVNAQGDGIDSNGDVTQTGGDVLVAGTTNNGNGAIDFDGTYNISGGTLIAYGTTGMWQSPSSISTQYNVSFSYSGKAGDSIEINDLSGNTIASFNTDKAYGVVLLSSPKLEKGKTYTLYVNGSKVSSLELTDIVTSQVSGNGMIGGGIPGNNQGEMMDGMKSEMQGSGQGGTQKNRNFR